MKTYVPSIILIVTVLTLAAGADGAQANANRVQPATIARHDANRTIGNCHLSMQCPSSERPRQMADGTGPIQTCRPGANCGPDDQLRLTGRSWERVILGSLLPESRQASTA